MGTRKVVNGYTSKTSKLFVYLDKRYWKKNCKILKNGCWEWLHGRFRKGYGSISLPNVRTGQKAHRYGYELFKGPIPKGKLIAHSCDFTSCVNPKHLFARTNSENCKEGWERNPKNAERRKLISAQSKQLMKDPKHSAKVVAALKKFRNENKRVYSERSRVQMLKLWNDLVYRKRQLAAIAAGRGVIYEEY